MTEGAHAVLSQANLVHWAIRGLAGCVRILEGWYDAGVRGGGDSAPDFFLLADRVKRLALLEQGYDIPPIDIPRKYL